MKLMKTNAQRAKLSKFITIAISAALAVSLMTVTAFAAGGAGGAGGGTGADAAYQSTINFFITWIRSVGWMIAFVGGIMFALAIKNHDAEQKQAGLLTMVAGFVVAALCLASDMFNLFG